MKLLLWNIKMLKIANMTIAAGIVALTALPALADGERTGGTPDRPGQVVAHPDPAKGNGAPFPVAAFGLPILIGLGAAAIRFKKAKA